MGTRIRECHEQDGLRRGSEGPPGTAEMGEEEPGIIAGRVQHGTRGAEIPPERRAESGQNQGPTEPCSSRIGSVSSFEPLYFLSTSE